MTRSFVAAFVATTLTACSSVPFLQPESPEAARERQITERFALCMDRTIGRTGVFASPETRRKAAETCNEVARGPSASEPSKAP